MLFLLWATSLAVAMALAGPHELLCRFAINAVGRRWGGAEASRFTRHATAWLVVVLPSCVACLLMALIISSEKTAGGWPVAYWYGTLLLGISIAGFAGCLVGTACWGISLLYTGARTISQVSRSVAAWCVLCNAFLYLSAASAVTLLIMLAR